MWYITNINHTSLKTQIILERYYVYFSKESESIANFEEKWILLGHIFPRTYVDKHYDQFNGVELIENLYLKYGDDFIKHVKGQFVVVHLLQDSFKIYSDHFAIRKFFFWQENDKFIISDDLKVISEVVKLTPSRESIANYAIDYHFTGGTTAFENVYHNQPAEIIEYKNNGLHSSSYWNPADLLSLKQSNVNIRDISVSLSEAVDNGLNLINNDKISLSLTGGADTRNLLAVFLSKGLKPHLYTYGNPASADCLKSKAIAYGLGLNHSIHNISMTSQLFEEYARKIIRLEGGLTSIHRAHRIIAVENEKQFADNMFLGTLGGEFIKGVTEDDYIVPSIVYNNWNTSDFTKDQLITYLQKKHIKPDNLNLENLLSLVRSQPYMNGDVICRKFSSLTYITAHLHDAQDVNLYRSVMDDVFTPFLDIDYLELIFSSKYTFNNKERIENKYLRRINNPVYASNFLKVTYPPLTKFLYSGDHKPSEVLFNKYFAAVSKMIRQKTVGKYEPNFPLTSWIVEFVEKNLPLCYNSKVLSEVFDLYGLMIELKKGDHMAKESYWLKFTNPIMMYYLIEEFTYE